jgi:hypothetical protein
MKSRIVQLISAILISGFFVISCATPDTASVRINLGNYQGLRADSTSWIDRIVQILTLSKPVYAQTAPTGARNLRVEISAPDFELYTVVADGTSDVIEINDILAGKDRTFAVVADYDGDGIYSRFYGGMQTVDLNGGESKDITIVMGNLPYFTDMAILTQSGGDQITVDASISGVYTKIEVYRYHVDTGEWTFLGDFTTPSMDDAGLILGHTYRYRLIPYNAYGHGETQITNDRTIVGF